MWSREVACPSVRVRMSLPAFWKPRAFLMMFDQEDSHSEGIPGR